MSQSLAQGLPSITIGTLTARHHRKSWESQICYRVREKGVESVAETRWVKSDPRKDKGSRCLHRQTQGRCGGWEAPTFHGTPLAVPSPTLSANNASTWHPRLLQPAETDRITKRMHHRQIKPSTVSHFSNLMAFLLETSNLR